MKRIILLRHAKSSWNDPDLDDQDRPLAGRGKRDAPVMGLFLKNEHYIPDLVICSTAKRARKTLKRVLEAMKIEPAAQYESYVYREDSAFMKQELSSLKEKVNSVMVVGHNPELELLTESLTGSPFPHNKFSTSAIAVIDFEVKRWRDIESMNGKLTCFMAPKML